MRTEKHSTLCKFCGEFVNLNEEGATYKDGSCAHEGCHDGEESRKENAPDNEGYKPCHCEDYPCCGH